MANLGTHQKITRVISGKPFGNGSNGSYSSATIPSMTIESCSGTAESNELTTAGSSLSDNNIILIHQSRGTGVGQWEINRVASGGGTTSIILAENLQYTYTDSGASQAQAVVIPQYEDVTVESGTWTLTGWAGNTNGILAFASRGKVTITGTISANGKGYRGGAGDIGLNTTGNQGEGTPNTGGASTSANDGGGGGSSATNNGCSGGGGGGSHGTAGTAGEDPANGTPGAAGDTTSDSADLINAVFGPGGGGTGCGDNAPAETIDGGNGGGAVFIFAKDITITGGITSNGLNGENGSGDSGGAGGGSGGAVLLALQTGTLGTTKIVATGGSGGSDGAEEPSGGGSGGSGRVAVHHSSTVTGTSNPSFEDVEDSTLVEDEDLEKNYAFFM